MTLVFVIAGPLYGFEVAELAALPASMLIRARELAQRLHEEWKTRREQEEEMMETREILRYDLEGVID